MVSIVRILLLSVCAATLVRGQTSVCYSSLDCHGNELDVLLPEKSEASLFPSECCSSAVRGLSYRQSEGEPCANCYTDDNFEGYGNKFYLALFGNFQPQTSFARIGKVRLSVSPVTEEVSSFTVERQGKETKYTAPTEVEYKSEDVNLDSIKTRDQSIVIRSENGDALSVVAFAEEYSSSDTFRVMPCVRLPDVGYEYYAVSVPKASLKLEFGDLDIIADVEGKSAIVIVTTEDNTNISITLTQDITNVDANDIMRQIGGGDTLSAGVEYTFNFSQSKQTLYLASEDDLTGSRVVSSKPIAFISGHECGTVPFNIHYCDQLVEQLAPSATWGKRFISAPIEGRFAVDVFRVVASRDNTILRSSCFQGNIITLNAGEFREFNMSSSSYCYYESNEPLLVVQFSVASDLDNVLAGDPFMVVVPPVEQYRNSYNISTFVSSDETNPGTNYINILFPASGSPQDILFDGQPLSSSVQFVEIPCVFSEEVCAYAAQMNITAVSHVLNTSDPSVVVNAIVYWLSFRVGHGYFAGMTQDPIALPMISLDQEEYEEFENNTLVITIVRSGDFALPITVYLTSIQVTRDNAALVDVDFVARSEEVIVSEPSTVVLMKFMDDVFPEGDEQFEMFLSAAPGALVVSPAYATVTILNEDPPLPVMNVSFVATNIDVIEGAGVIKLEFKKTEGAIGPVSIRIYTEEGTAIEGEDFIGVNDTLTFGVNETEMEVLVFILDNSALEELEQFIVKIEAIKGIIPVAVTNSTATVLVDDNDVVVLGFSQVDFTTSENVEGVEVRVEVMVGQLERSVAVWVNSTQQSTATPGQDFERVSRLLTFDSERNSGVVRFGIFDDVKREVAIETVNLQLSFVEEEVNIKIRLLPNQMVVSIVDDDEVEVGMLPVRGTVREGEGSARVNIIILRGTLGDVPISFIVSTANGTAQANTDYEQREEVVILSDLNPFEELIFPVMDDSEYEGKSNEIFFVQVQLDPNGQNSERVKIASDLARTQITIIDNEVRPFASIGFIQRTWMVSEGAGEVVLLLESDGRNVEPVEVTYSFQNGSETAEVGLDYLNGGGVGTLLFPPGTTIAAITVPIIDDESAESTEFFTVSLFPGQDVALTADQATLYIEDNDAVEAQLSMTSYTTSEAAASVEVVIQISTATETVQVNISTVDGTALAGLDYVQREVQLTFSPGDFERSVTIQVINDRLQEDTELFFVTLHSSVSNLKVELPQTNTGIFVIDDDKVGDPLEPSLSVGSTSTTSASLVWTQEPIQPVTRFFLSWTYTGSCDPQPPQSVIIRGEERSYTIMDLEEGANYTFGLTAINGIGTSPKNMVIGYTLPAAPSGSPRNLQATEITESSVVIHWEEIDCLDQNGIIIRYEITLNGSLLSSTDPGQFTSSILNLSPETGYIITVTGVNEAGNGPTSTITIHTARHPAIIIGFDSANYIVNESDGTVTLIVSVLEGTLSDEQSIPVRVITADDSAQAPSDYTQVSSVLTFTSSSTTQTVDVTIEDDSLLEIDEVFRATLELVNSDDSSRVTLSPAEASVTIFDDDEAIIGFDPDANNATEGTDLFVDLNVEVISGQLGRDVIVLFNTMDGFAISGADFDSVSNQHLIFSPTVSTLPVRVSILNDNVLEQLTERFTATLSSEIPRLTLSPDEAIVDIFDDDLVTFGFDQAQYSVLENASFVTVTIRQISGGALDRNVFITLETGSGTAISSGEQDFMAHSVELTFGPGNTQQDVMIAIIDDRRLEHDEQLNSVVSLTVADPAVDLSPAVASITIIDNDKVIIGFTQTRYDVSENISQAMVYVEVIDGILRRQVIVNVSSVDNTALAGSDYTAVGSTPLTFDMNNLQFVIPIDIIDDRVQELDENFMVLLTTFDDAVILEPGQTTVQITNDKQLGQCRASINCNGDIILMTTLEDCCLNTAGLAFSVSAEQCISCIVFGFFQDSFTGIEQGQSHVVQAGWQKGAAQAGVNLQFNVVDKGITAREGASLDYTISTGLVRFLYRSPNPSSVVCIFRTDNIAQEINETLTVELVQVSGTTALPTGDHVFFRNTINMIIIDSDVVEISFTEDDFRADEAPADGAAISFMPVRVTKSSRIANPIVLDVIPLTVDVANASTPPALPENIPLNNPFSPPFADLNDFNNTVIRITFNPDEVTDVNERATPIPIIDDLVNEADEQVFIVQLHLVNSINPGAIDLTTRAASICRIIDDDTIRIGFEVAQYTYIEPTFDTTIDEFDYIPPTNLTDNGPIYLVKEDNVVSEQTFLVEIKATDTVPSGSGFRPAQINFDYSIGVVGTSRVLQFPASFQRILFEFTLLSDNLPEGTEAFLVSSSPDNFVIINGTEVQVPSYLRPVSLFPQAYVIIQAGGPLTIGFNETRHMVDESIGRLQIYVRVSNPPDDVKLFAAIHVVIQTVSKTATGGDDYVEINVQNFDVTLTFNDATRQLSFEVTIIDDDLFESVEDFNLELRYDPFFAVPSGVELSPNVLTVYILDDDNVTIGFINPPYSLFENGSLVIQVGVLEGSLQREVVVNFSTSDLTAIGGDDYAVVSNSLLTFGPANTLVDIPVTINDNNVYELTEMFSAAITFLGDPLRRVTLSPESALISIIDEDVLSFGFEPTVYSVSESAGSIDLNIFFIGNPGAFVPHVFTSTVDGTATGSGLEADYVSIVAHQLSFTSLDTSQALTVQIGADSFTELNETFSANLSQVFLADVAGGQAINLTNQESSRLILNPDSAMVTIDDDDVAIIGFFNTELNISEDGGFLNFNVGVLDGTLRIEVVVYFNTEDRSAHAGQDYNQTISSLTFTGQLSLSVPVGIIHDTLFETLESFVGLLSADNLPSNVLLAPTEATGTILNNEPIIIGFDPANYNVNESDGTVTLIVSVLEGTLSDEQSIPVRVITADDSAQAPSDYTQVSSVLTFTSSSTTLTVDVTIEDDSLLEIDEVFRATLGLVNSDDSSRVTLSPAEASVTIFDDDEVQEEPTAPMLRLADGSNEREGRVEIFVNEEWGTVCDDNWDLLDALVVCKQLGLGTIPEAFIEAEFGRGTGEIWLDEVGCTGEEDRLIDCSSLGIGNNNCGHSEDAGVRCHANADCSDGAIRLVNGSSSTNGRVEVCQFGRWGTVCDDLFDTVDAMVACRQLGFGGGSIIATTIPGSGPIWLDDVACDGKEDRLVDCSATKFDQSNCGHNEDVSIMCFADT